MSYNIYTTKGIVLSLLPIREADGLYTILSRDLGVIFARASGTRKENSKLRAGLEPLSLSSISLIKGKSNWRVTSSFLLKSISPLQKTNKDLAKSLFQALFLLEKLVQGEEKHKELFDAIEDIFITSANLTEDSDTALAIEIVLVSRILYHLGYLAERDVPKEVIRGEFNKELSDIVIKNKKKIIEVINQGIRTTGLV
ncbi:MAG: DNA repair protein RecO [Parcubacteria bacterium C7867-005]|nr:MAG: DNA repair protein RecO [Parcubacteria bacterium C7867-005]